MARISVDERSQQFVEAAARVIAHEGASAATTRRIAAEAGAPLAALHYCFRSKDDLLEAVYDYLSRDFVAALSPLDDDLDLEQTVRRHINRISDRIRTHPYEQVTTFEILLRVARAHSDEERASALTTSKRMFAGWEASTANIYQQAIDRAGVTPLVTVEDAARMTVAGVDGLSLQMITDPDPAREARLLSQLANLIITMLSGRPFEDVGAPLTLQQ